MSDQPHDFQPAIWECEICETKFDREFHSPNKVPGLEKVRDECLSEYFSQCELCDGLIEKNEVGRNGLCPLCGGPWLEEETLTIDKEGRASKDCSAGEAVYYKEEK